FYLLGRVFGGAFDSRLVTLLAYGLALWLATRLVADPDKRLIAVAAVAGDPPRYLDPGFGGHRIPVGGLLLGARGPAPWERPLLAAALLGLACGTKQLAWPFAPFLLAHLSGAATLRELVQRESRRRLLRPLLVTLAVFVGVVAPVALLDLRRFWADI